MTLDKLQEGVLKRLVREDAWDILVKAMGEYIDKINAEEITGGDAFQELRALHERQGGVKHLKAFFDAIEKKNL